MGAEAVGAGSPGALLSTAAEPTSEDEPDMPAMCEEAVWQDETASSSGDESVLSGPMQTDEAHREDTICFAEEDLAEFCRKCQDEDTLDKLKPQPQEAGLGQTDENTAAAREILASSSDEEMRSSSQSSEAPSPTRSPRATNEEAPLPAAVPADADPVEAPRPDNQPPPGTASPSPGPFEKAMPPLQHPAASKKRPAVPAPSSSDEEMPSDGQINEAPGPAKRHRSISAERALLQPEPANAAPEASPDMPGPCAREEPMQPLRRPASGMKRPGARGPFPNELCQAKDCCFCPKNPGTRARVQRTRGESKCLFCNEEHLQSANKIKRPNRITNALKKFASHSENVFLRALDRIRLALGEEIMRSYEAKAKGQGKKEPRRPCSQPGWEAVLERRKSSSTCLFQKNKDAYFAAVRKDQRIARRKIFFPEKLMSRASEEAEEEEREAVAATGTLGHLAANDTDLPVPPDALLQYIELWCKEGSWGCCVGCGSLIPRNLEPQDTRSVRAPTVPQRSCAACRSGAYVPKPEDVPAPLQNLKPKVIEALRPLEIDTGKFQRAQYGYRIHSCMVSFAWAPFSVDVQISALSRSSDRKAGRRALEYLLGQNPGNTNLYKKFYDQHKAFLRKHGEEAPEKKRKRPLRWIEQEGIECCLWPHLYWKASMCMTVARLAHEARRLKRAARPNPREEDSQEEENSQEEDGPQQEEDSQEEEGSQQEEDSQEEDDEEGEGGEEQSEELLSQSQLEEKEPDARLQEDDDEQPHGRIRQLFLTQVFSPLVGYGADYDLLHFVYDLSMWTTIGTKKNIAAAHAVPLRLVLKLCPWAPQYWRIRHQAVIDLQRQCGNASLFRTRAPYERTFPYHRWVMDEQLKLGRPRLHLAGPETFHMAHVLLQLDKEFICGAKFATGKPSRTWQNHLLGCSDGSGRPTVNNHVTRLEFQDGKRKLPSQPYHGKGTVHSHSLDFLQHIASIGLERKISASIPSLEEDRFLHGLVLDSQRDRKDSKRPVREEASVWDNTRQLLLLHHTEEDHAEKVRAYFPATMSITKCHEDIQQGDGNGPVLHYVATYSTKFSSFLA